jgi:hypothetical protein
MNLAQEAHGATVTGYREVSFPSKARVAAMILSTVAANADLLPPLAAITATLRSAKSAAKAESRSY